MRELKFRAWNPNAQEYQGYAGVINMPLHEAGALASTPLIFDFQQYTGLKDKNGVEIYCGDIISYGADSNGLTLDILMSDYVVKWNEDSAGFNVSKDMFDCWSVIGNICENPELLSK